MRQLSPLVIVYADQAGETPAEQLAFALGEERADTVSGIDAAIRLLSDRPTPPAYLIVDIGGQGWDALEGIDRLAEYCDPSIRVVACGAANDVRLYRELRKRGMIEYFPYPVRISDMRDALRNQALVKTSAHGGREREGAVIAFMSAASGDGASTVALNTAYALAHVYNQPTVIVDMDYQFGMIARHLDINAPFGIRELLEYPDRGVDQMLVSKMLFNYGENLKVIAAPGDLRRMPPVSPQLIRDMIAVLKSQFAYVIIDVPHIWADWTSAILAQSNHQVMIAQLWLRSLTHQTRLLAAWREVGLSKESISLVVNRSGAKFKEAITPEDAERIGGKVIDHYLANDIKSVAHAENQGKTIVEIGPSLLERQFRELAEALLDKTGNPVARATAEPDSVKAKVSLLRRKKPG